MPPLLKRRLAICAGVFTAVWVSLALYLLEQPRFFSSPTANRQEVEGDFRAPYRTWREYDQAQISSDGNSPARVRFTLEQAGLGDDVFIISEPPESLPAMTGKASNVQKLHVTRAKGAAAALPPGEVRLLAVAARWNTGNPEIDNGSQDVEFLEPESLQAFDWASSQAPPGLRALRPAAPNTVRLRFLLETSGDGAQFFPGNAAVFDARTRFMVGNQHSVELNGRVAALDVTATLWHDTPIQLVFDLPRGEPIVRELPLASGQSTWFQGPRAPVLNVLARGQGQIAEANLPAEVMRPFSGRALKLIPGTGSYLLFNTPHTESGEFFQLQLREGETHWFQSTTYRHGQVQTTQTLEDAKVAFYPERDRLWFEIPGMPILPNRRDEVRNLFEVKIPFVDASQPDATAKMVRAAQMQLNFDLSISRVKEMSPRPQPMYRNLTPDAYLKLLSPVHVSMKDETAIVLGAPPDSLVERVRKWWKEWR